MKRAFFMRHPLRAMTLVEVAIAAGIVAFCLVSLIGLMPKMLSGLRESREKTLAQRMYQTVSEDLHEDPISVGQTRKYEFDEEGFLLKITPSKQGLNLRNGTMRFSGSATTNSTASLPGSLPNGKLILSCLSLTDTVTRKTIIQRPVWSVKDD